MDQRSAGAIYQNYPGQSGIIGGDNSPPAATATSELSSILGSTLDCICSSINDCESQIARLIGAVPELQEKVARREANGAIAPSKGAMYDLIDSAHTLHERARRLRDLTAVLGRI